MSNLKWRRERAEKKSKEKSGEEIKEIQCRESARAEKRERSRSGNLRPGVIFTNVKLNLKELALTGNNKKHKKATWEFYQRKGKGPRSGIYVTTQKNLQWGRLLSCCITHSSRDLGCQQHGVTPYAIPFPLYRRTCSYLYVQMKTDIFPSMEFFL